MYGAILGDIIGSPYEFDCNNYKSKDFPLFCRHSEFTDDTVMTLAVAKALLDTCGQDDAAIRAALVRQMQQLGRAYPDRGYGTHFGGWLYEDDPHHNCVFVGLDENGAARHAHLRSTGSQGKVFRINVESSDIKHSFHKNGTDRSLYVFEAPIDLLSHITLYPAGWLEHSYVACCGTSIQPVLERLRQNPKLDTVYLCLDNDEAGEDACDGMMDTLEDMGYDVERLRPEGKDWNDDLRAKRGGHG